MKQDEAGILHCREKEMSCPGPLNPEDLWWRVLILIVLGFLLIIFIVNAIYFGRLRSRVCNAVTVGESNALFWINIVWAILTGVFFVWSFIRLFFHPSVKKASVTPTETQQKVMAKTTALPCFGRGEPLQITSVTSPVSAAGM